MKRLLLVIVLMSASQLAIADCWYSGNLYPTGTVIGGLTCQADGSWR